MFVALPFAIVAELTVASQCRLLQLPVATLSDVTLLMDVVNVYSLHNRRPSDFHQSFIKRPSDFRQSFIGRPFDERRPSNGSSISSNGSSVPFDDSSILSNNIFVPSDDSSILFNEVLPSMSLDDESTINQLEPRYQLRSNT